MSALSAVLSTRVVRRRKFGEVSCTKCTVQGNGCELIPTVKMETRNLVEGYFSSEFPAICNHCGVMAVWGRKTSKRDNIFAFVFGKTTPYAKIFKIMFWKFSLRHRSTCCVQLSCILATESCVAYLTKKTKFSLTPLLSLLRGSRPKSARPAPNNVLTVL